MLHSLPKYSPVGSNPSIRAKSVFSIRHVPPFCDVTEGGRAAELVDDGGHVVRAATTASGGGVRRVVVVSAAGGERERRRRRRGPAVPAK